VVSAVPTDHAWSILGGVEHAIQEHKEAALSQMEKQTNVDTVGAGLGLDLKEGIYFKFRAYVVARVKQVVG
jgi:hypothetical protein